MKLTAPGLIKLSCAHLLWSSCRHLKTSSRGTTRSCNPETELPSIALLPGEPRHDGGRRGTSIYTCARLHGFSFLHLPALEKLWSQGQWVDPVSPVCAQRDLFISVWNSQVTVEDVFLKLNHRRVKSWLCLVLCDPGNIIRPLNLGSSSLKWKKIHAPQCSLQHYWQ